MSNNFKIFYDKPIDDFKEDLLGRKPFVENLYNLIKKSLNNCSHSLTIDISAKYGEGKSSVINLLKKTIKKEDNIKIMEFSVLKYLDKMGLYT